MFNKKITLSLIFIILTTMLISCRNNESILENYSIDNSQSKNGNSLILEHEITNNYEKIIFIYYDIDINHNNKLYKYILGDADLLNDMLGAANNSNIDIIIKTMSALNTKEIEILTERHYFNNAESLEEIIDKHNLEDYTVIKVLMGQKYSRDSIYQECEEFFIIGNIKDEIKIYGVHSALLN